MSTLKVDLEAVKIWYHNKTKDKPCIMCGGTHLEIHDEFVDLRPFSGLNTITAVVAIPHVAVVCKICGHSEFFNAIVMGLLHSNPDSVN